MPAPPDTPAFDAPDLEARAEAAVAFAREAGRRTLDWFRDDALEVDRKRDGSVVTEADRETEHLLRARIAAAFPGDAILGEEHGSDGAGPEGWRWVLDPIDGTRSFVQGVPLYGTLVGVERDGVGLAGVIEMPALDERVFAAQGQGAFHQEGAGPLRPARVSDCDRLEDAVVCTTAIDYFTEAGCPEVFLELADAAAALRGWSDCYAHLLCATGRCDAVIEPVMHPWDASPMVPILREAGGRCTSWAGVETAHDGDCLVSNGRLHDALRALLGDRRGLRT